MTQLSLDLARAHDNRQLFSNHFLDERLRGDAVWTEVAAEAERVRCALRERLDAQRAALEGANERQTEERWIIPVLRELGWGFEVQPVSRRQGSTQFPDYALFASQAEADAATHHDHRSVLKRGVGVLEAKRWGRGLDGRGAAADEDPNHVPSSQIVNYLVRAEQPWGVLTNGGEWRLYFRDADFADTVFFSVDLPALLGDGERALGDIGHTLPAREAFRYFYLFFRPEAFRPTAEGHRWLDLVRGASLRYARAVEDALKPRAYRAVTALCRGFVASGAFDPRSLRTDPALAVLERNHPGRVRIDVAAPLAYGARNPARERIADAHATSTGRLAPLAAEFADVDARADRLVYRLYGLGEAEIRLVHAEG